MLTWICSISLTKFVLDKEAILGLQSVTFNYLQWKLWIEDNMSFNSLRIRIQCKPIHANRHRHKKVDEIMRGRQVIHIIAGPIGLGEATNCDALPCIPLVKCSEQQYGILSLLALKSRPQPQMFHVPG